MADYVLRYSRWVGRDTAYFVKEFAADDDSDATSKAEEIWAKLCAKRQTLLRFENLTKKLDWKPEDQQ